MWREGTGFNHEPRRHPGQVDTNMHERIFYPAKRDKRSEQRGTKWDWGLAWGNGFAGCAAMRMFV